MTKQHPTLKVFLLVVFVLALSAAAQAQATRTWVSGVGDDVNPCSRTAPCKTFAGAISKTAKDGEISTLDPGGFGTLTITKSITVNGGGGGQGYGSVLSALAPQGFLINITDVNDIRKSVKLNWLDINGASSGTDGIRFIAGNSLVVENTNIDGLTGDGIEIAGPASGTVEVFVRNVSVRNCVGTGMKITSAGSTVNVSVDSSQFANSGTGVDVQGGTLNISNSVVSGSTNAGISAGGAVGSVINANDNIVTNNGGAGITAATASGTVRLNNNSVHRNGTGLNNSGVMQSCSNNKVYGNTTDLTGAVAAIAAPGSCTR
ncbi:MAG TPA: right-handed parallel beta-helix repeat-containing protein [Pyrinomonadaceae bacterium]|nr:right-handed parallel beta-helix repeat-containing protein [Pyrinomonadaceae bacterium]